MAGTTIGKLRAEALARFLDGWEADHGSLPAAEIAQAEQELSPHVTNPPAGPSS